MPDRIRVVEGDIVRQEVDAIVNAANESLLGGGGVDGAIHGEAGPGLLAECRSLGGCPAGEARITRGHALMAAHVVHAVGPVWRGGAFGEDDLLAACHRHAMRLARAAGARSLAFPAISTGAYRFPLERAARVAVAAVADALAADAHFAEIRFVCLGRAAAAAFERARMDRLARPRAAPVP